MPVLQLQFGEEFECSHHTGKQANEMQKYLDELLGVWVDHPNGHDTTKALLFFEYLGADGYGYGIYYDPQGFSSVEIAEEERECLLFLSEIPELARQKAEEYAHDVVREQGLQPMLFGMFVADEEVNQ